MSCCSFRVSHRTTRGASIRSRRREGSLFWEGRMKNEECISHAAVRVWEFVSLCALKWSGIPPGCERIVTRKPVVVPPCSPGTTHRLPSGNPAGLGRRPPRGFGLPDRKIKGQVALGEGNGTVLRHGRCLNCWPRFKVPIWNLKHSAASRPPRLSARSASNRVSHATVFVAP
jgi:hypothetical protein